MKTGLKKIFFILFAAALVTLTSTCVYADISALKGPLTELENDAMIGKTTFAWDEVPWAKVSFQYMTLPPDAFQVEWTWTYEGTPAFTETLNQIKESPYDYQNPVIFAKCLDNWLTTKRALGWWTVETRWKSREGGSHWQDQWTEGDDVRFQVTPEPVASALFLIGGAAIVALRKKRK